MRIVALILLTFIGAGIAAGIGATSQPAFAQNDEVTLGPVPAWAKPSELVDAPESGQGTVFARRQDVAMHLDEGGNKSFQPLMRSIGLQIMCHACLLQSSRQVNRLGATAAISFICLSAG